MSLASPFSRLFGVGLVAAAGAFLLAGCPRSSRRRRRAPFAKRQSQARRWGRPLRGCDLSTRRAAAAVGLAGALFAARGQRRLSRLVDAWRRSGHARPADRGAPHPADGRRDARRGTTVGMSTPPRSAAPAISRRRSSTTFPRRSRRICRCAGSAKGARSPVCRWAATARCGSPSDAPTIIARWRASRARSGKTCR